MMDFETKQAKERLIAGSATQQDRDRVLYFLAESRWTPNQLDEHIKSVHSSLCASCPEKKRAERAEQRRPLDWNSIIKTLLWIFAALSAIIAALVKASLPTF